MSRRLRRAGEGDASLQAAINTTPLVDIMLVLLIIFLITVPVVRSAIATRLPKEASRVHVTQRDDILITVDAGGSIYWNDVVLDGMAALRTRLEALASLPVAPAVQIRGDRAAHFEAVGRVLRACRQAGVPRISFVTEAPPRG